MRNAGYALSKIILAAAVLVVSVWLWFLGLQSSPFANPELLDQQQFTARYIQDNAPDMQAERALAEAYWKRYKDVRNHTHFGIDGPRGIFGARTHFEQHGKKEGRIFAPIHIPDDLVLEQQLADQYWQRYPDIEQSDSWGRKSQLGILGPRDHYLHYGRYSGRVWGASQGIK